MTKTVLAAAVAAMIAAPATAETLSNTSNDLEILSTQSPPPGVFGLGGLGVTTGIAISTILVAAVLTINESQASTDTTLQR